MSICNKCKVELNDNNWYESYKKWKKNMCKSCSNKATRRRYNNNKQVYLVRCREYQLSHKDEIKIKAKKRQVDRRVKVLSYYSNGTMSCACCGEKNYEFLTIDHINGKGRQHLKEVYSSGVTLVEWIIKNNFPSIFQILCYNCNCAKGHYGFCPHKKEVIT